MQGKQYKPRSWSDYNNTLVQRGSLSLWFDADTIKNWQACQARGKPGSPKTYSDSAILALSQLRFLFQMPLRMFEGFIKSMFRCLNLDLPVPHYSTLSRRLRKLKVSTQASPPQGNLCLAVDSSGLKVYGEGEWKTRIHGYSKRRTWRKFHIALDTSNQEAYSVVVTTNDFKDSELLDALLEQPSGKIATVLGDGAYDSHDCFKSCADKDIEPIIPPRKDAVISRYGNDKALKIPRDKIVRAIKKHGIKAWKKRSGYHFRSLVETFMYRFKRTFSDKLMSRDFKNQAHEVFIKCQMLNKYAKLGLANSRN